MTSKKKAWKRSAFIAVIVLSAVVIAWSILAAVSSVVISAGMAAPAVIGVVLILWSLFHLKYDRPVLRPKWLRIVFTSCVCLGIAMVLVLETLMITAAYTKPEKDAGVVIVLGCGIFPDGRLTLSLKNRLDAAFDYLIVHPDADCIVSGGQGDNEPVSEAQAMQGYLISRGIDDSRVFAEAESTSTEENLTFSLDIIEENNLSKQAAIVTSDYHVFRASLLAKRLGIQAFGIPSPTPWRVWLACQARECMAIVKTVAFPWLKMD